MENNEVLNLYNCGRWDVCIQIFNDYSSRIANIETLYSKIDDIDVIVKEFLFENNAAMCRAIMDLSKTKKNWTDLMDYFINLYSRYRCLKIIPLELELNVVYNILSWFLIKPLSLKNKTLHFNIVSDIVSKCLMKVLQSHREVEVGILLEHELYSDDISSLITLLERTSDCILHLPPVASLQLLDVITMTIHVLLRQEKESKEDCIPLFRRIIDQLELLRLHIQHKTEIGNEEIYFKFGLTCVNSTASLKNYSDSISAFVITSSLVYMINSKFGSAMDCLKCISKTEDTGFEYLVNYLKAYCCLHSQCYSEAKLFLAYKTTTPPSALYQASSQLLLGQLLSEQGDHEAALPQFQAAVNFSSHQSDIYSVAAYMAAAEAEKLNLSTAQISHLKQLVQCLREMSSEKGAQYKSFEHHCLFFLFKQLSITLHEAVYMLARQLYLTGYHIKALDSYTELLDLLKSELSEPSALLPCGIQILQETTLAHIKANRLTEGEQLCRKLVTEYTPRLSVQSDTEGEGKWETALYRMDEDIVSMLMLADLVVSSDKTKAIEQLTRCYNIVSELSEQAYTTQDSTDTHLTLCNWFLSRILLRKARLSCNDDRVHYFRRALIHKPGDKEVIFHYKQWSLWHPDHESFDPGDQVQVFPVDQVDNLALRHVLGCSVSEEEWMALFDQESSQNVLESLFDDS